MLTRYSTGHPLKKSLTLFLIQTFLICNVYGCSHTNTHCLIANYSLGVEDDVVDETGPCVLAFPTWRLEDFLRVFN